MNTSGDSERRPRDFRPGVPPPHLTGLWRLGCLILSLALASCGFGQGTVPAASSPMPTPALPSATLAATPVPTMPPSATPLPSPTTELPRPATPTAFPSPTVEPWEPETISAIGAVAENLINTVPLAGLTLAVRQSIRPTYVQGYGSANVQAHVPAQANTLYEIASLSKQFTAAAILQLAEQGKLQLDAPAAYYVPDLPTAAQTLTVRQLLNHTSGLPRNDYLYVMLSQPQPYPPSTVLAAYERSLNSLSFVPGTAWEYSNIGYFLLGVIIENVSGQSYGDFMAQHVFSAAGLAATRYCAEPPADLAQSYLVGGPKWMSVKPENLSLAFAAGGLCSTAPDLVAWQQALATGRVISPASYQAMISPVTLPDGTQTSYGFGLKIGAYGGQPAIYHQGLITGFSSTLAYYPGDDTTIVILSNTETQIEQLDAAVSQIREILTAQR